MHPYRLKMIISLVSVVLVSSYLVVCELVTVGVIMSGGFHTYSQIHMKPSLDLALEKLDKQNENGSFVQDLSFSYVLGKTGNTCDPDDGVHAPAVAADIFYRHNVSAFLVPSCPVSVMSVSDMADYWNLPIATGTLSLKADDRGRSPTLTTTSFILSELTTALAELSVWNHWKIFSILYTGDETYRMMAFNVRKNLAARGMMITSVFVNETTINIDHLNSAISHSRGKIPAVSQSS